MRTIFTFLLAVTTFLSAIAYDYSYRFSDTPVSEALLRISKEHPDITVSFIYRELDNYRTSARIDTDNPYDALRETIGTNPISIVKKNGRYYIEALQHGKYRYTGRIIGTDRQPVAAATVMLLAPKDSTVITYGIADDEGRFSIPCDRQDVIGKISSIGYCTLYQRFSKFKVGILTMEEYARTLGEVKVEADYARLYADKSVYVPTSRQKNASQTATDLLQRMAIPQLSPGNVFETPSRQPVKIYIDYIEATEQELSGIQMADVKRVEYYDYPSDSRFQGNVHVINFIMQQYEYGGYVKGILYDDFINLHHIQAYSKLQYKNMTYDWAAGGHYLNSRNDYQNSYQTFRLPLPDGTEKVIERNTETSDSRVEQYGYWTSFKALYRTDNVTASNMLTVDFASNPDSFHSGVVTYAPTAYQSNHYSSSRNSDNKSFVYNGNFFFRLPHNNSLTLTPSYAYTHTREASYYAEEGQDNIMNGAIDDSHQATATLSFIRPFNRWGTLQAICNGKMLDTHTRYSGSSSVEDNALTFRIGPGIRYTLSIAKVYGTAGAGFTWDHSSYGDITENMVAPWGELSLQYAPTLKNSISFAVNYKKNPPASHYRSESVIKENPFISYTGNPALVPFNSTSIDVSYTFIPNNRYTLSVYGYAWIVSNRYGFFYEAGPEGILRTMQQPLGIYKQWDYGISATTRQFDNQFQASAQLSMSNAHSGEPYIWTKSKLTLTLSAYYYLKNFYFSGSYQSPSGWADGCMTPEWIDYHATYQLQAGWSNGKWNLNLTAKNFLTKSLYNSTGTIRTPYYDCTTLSYSSFIRSISIAATYTFPFGKKVSAENEAYQATGASTGILK